jgi:hypothetical protein
LSDNPLDIDFYDRWQGYKEEKLADVPVVKGKEVLLVRDREVTPGFIKWWSVLVDSRNVQFSFHVDKNIKWDRTVDQLINHGHQNIKLQATPFLSRVDEQNDIYAVTFDPPRPVPYTKELILKVRNLDPSSVININEAFIQRVVRKVDKHVQDPLRDLKDRHPEVDEFQGLREVIQ